MIFIVNIEKVSIPQTGNWKGPISEKITYSDGSTQIRYRSLVTRIFA